MKSLVKQLNHLTGMMCRSALPRSSAAPFGAPSALSEASVGSQCTVSSNGRSRLCRRCFLNFLLDVQFR